MTLKDFVASARERLRPVWQKEESDALVGIVCSEFLGVQPYQFLVTPDSPVDDKKLEAAMQALSRLEGSEPIQYITGYTEFCGRRFKVSPAALIPRPETEILCGQAIEQAMKTYRSREAYGKSAKAVKILDLCTGSGCIAWTMALSVPGSEVSGIDVSSEALELASSQKFKTGDAFNAPEFFQADIFDDNAMSAILESRGPFDIIVSNPPYILREEAALMSRNVLDFEPDIALFVPDGEPMLFNAKIAEILKKWGNMDSFAFVEINDGVQADAERLFRSEGFSDVSAIKDFSGRKRVIRFHKNQ